VICNEEDTDGRLRVTVDEERVPNGDKIIIIINDICKAHTSPRSKCAKSTVA